MTKKIIVICGPTASGKSELAIKLALQHNGEIISADSMQAYKGLNIGTAKPSVEEQKLVRHHLIDILDISEPMNVHKYVTLAEDAISDIFSRDKTPFIVGGSGMYLRALLFGIDLLPADKTLRSELEKEFEGEKGFEKLKKIMSEVDTLAFAKWHSNHRRLLRAYEVYKITGKSIVTLQSGWDTNPRHDSLSFYLSWEREELKRRIAERTDKMLAAGWIDEAKNMIAHGLLQAPTAWQALGYSIIAKFLSGEIGYNEMREKIITATWQFARRQETWFKNKHPNLKIIKMPQEAEYIKII